MNNVLIIFAMYFHKKNEMDNLKDNNRDILERMREGEPIRLDDPQYYKVLDVVNRTIGLSAQLNTSTSVDLIRERLSEIICCKIDESTTIFAPFYTNFGQFIQIGKDVFINHSRHGRHYN
jgi:hypothetical protein